MNDFLFEALKTPKIRKELTRHSIKAYMSVYFHEHMEYDFAPFHQTYFDACEETRFKYVIVSAFRESAKTTVFTTCFPLWSIMGVQGLKFVLIVAKTKDQAERYLENIRIELETNELLKQDLGPFKIEKNGEGQTWSSTDIDLTFYGARITIVSQNQGYRGIKFGHHRPELIICDDLEDVDSVRSQEIRDKMYQKILADLMPAGHNQRTRFFFVGNLIHDESYLLRLKHNLVDKGNEGLFLKIPLLDKNGKSRWPEKFPDNKMEQVRLKVGGTLMFNREYLLIPSSGYDMIVQPKWIKREEELPSRADYHLEEMVISIDPAFSLKESADYTAVVAAYVYIVKGRYEIHFLPKYLERRISVPDLIQKLKWFIDKYGQKRTLTIKIIVESNGAQELLANNIETALFEYGDVYVYREKNLSTDKVGRLQAATFPMEQGHVFFPQKYNHPLRQLLNFHEGLKHDDLPDAISMLINVTHQFYGAFTRTSEGGNLIRFRH